VKFKDPVMQMEGKIFCFRSEFHRLDESKASKRRKKKVRWLTPRKVWERTADSNSDESESGSAANREQYCVAAARGKLRIHRAVIQGVSVHS
jgi:hypothetical protein